MNRRLASVSCVECSDRTADKHWRQIVDVVKDEAAKLFTIQPPERRGERYGVEQGSFQTERRTFLSARRVCRSSCCHVTAATELEEIKLRLSEINKDRRKLHRQRWAKRQVSLAPQLREAWEVRDMAAVDRHSRALFFKCSVASIRSGINGCGT